MSGFRAKLAIPFAAGALLASAAPVYGADVLTAAKVAAAPKVSAFASDPAWA